jgi:hypothetical protein
MRLKCYFFTILQNVECDSLNNCYNSYCDAKNLKLTNFEQSISGLVFNLLVETQKNSHTCEKLKNNLKMTRYEILEFNSNQRSV